MKLVSDVGADLRGTVADILGSKETIVNTIGPRESVYDAIAKMTERRVGALLVLEGETMVGIVSERDYRTKVVLLGRKSTETRVEEIMTPNVLTVEPDTSLKECMEIVARHGVRHLPVVQDGRVLDTLNSNDLVRAVLAQQAETIQSLKSFIGSDYPS